MPLDTGLLDKCEFQIIAMLKLKMQVMTTESLSLARAQRRNRNTLENIFTCWKKYRQTITFVAQLGTF
jgi:hypothetical protein